MAQRHVKFTQTKLRGETNLVQVANIEFFDNSGNQIKVKNASNPEGCNPDGNVPENVIDGNTSTKWLDMNKGSLVLEFGKAYHVASYKWATANDCNERDPVRWTLEGSTDGKKYKMLDDRSSSDYATPEDRGEYTGSCETDYKRDQDAKKAAAAKKPSRGSAKDKKSKKRTSTSRGRNASKRKRR